MLFLPSIIFRFITSVFISRQNNIAILQEKYIKENSSFQALGKTGRMLFLPSIIFRFMMYVFVSRQNNIAILQEKGIKETSSFQALGNRIDSVDDFPRKLA